MASRFLMVIAALLLLFTGADMRTADPPPHRQPTDTVLADGWRLSAADRVSAGAATVSSAGFDDSAWLAVPRMPGTVLGILADAGVYPDLYYGKNLLTEVPQDLYRKDWWYRTTFTAPAGFTNYRLNFPGINYRADIWLNGERIADSRRIVGMYADHELDVARWITPGAVNTLAVKVIPERAIQDVDGVELADSWWDWINWRYLGYQGPGSNPANGTSFVSDRNAGVFKPVRLRTYGPVDIGPAVVSTELPALDLARLSLHTTVRNDTDKPATGVLRATISREGKPDIVVAQAVSLLPREQRDLDLRPSEFPQLSVASPDLWWPYTMGTPALHQLRLEFVQGSSATSSRWLKFGIRTVTSGRDEKSGPDGGDFYLQVNGRGFPVRGATYTPDLLLRDYPDRDAAILRYVTDLGLNMLRLESKILSEGLIEKADELGIPLMLGWMCCNQWERWGQWDAEDRRVAKESLRSQIAMLAPHASVFMWANGSDGRPPEEVRSAYRRILEEAHWPNVTVDTVSAFARGPDGGPLWDGIRMAGPYSWRPPSYWFAGRFPAARGASAEQGDNEHVPPYASLRKFIPPDKLWPINDTWYFHAGANDQNAELTNIRRIVDRRYGPSTGAEMFADKAQLAHYENTRAQFEAFAAGGWARHKMTIYWMLNSHWPSFFGNIFDYYLRPGGAYYGAKKGLRPLSVVFDSYATGDHSAARVSVVNQSPVDHAGLRVRVRVYDLDGRVRDSRGAQSLSVGAGGAVEALTVPRGPADSAVYFVRCELFDPTGRLLGDNVYWQSQILDDVGPPGNDTAFESRQVSWADLTALNTMPRAVPEVTARAEEDGSVTIQLRNPGPTIAFFQRAELLSARDGEEILPISYDDNYVTVFPGETVTVRGEPLPGGPAPRWVRVSGYNSAPVVTAVR